MEVSTAANAGERTGVRVRLGAGAERPWRGFREALERNAGRPITRLIAGDLAGRPGDGKRWAALAAVLARFQIGEAGEGRVAREIDGVVLPGIDEDYRQALKLFVKEEGRHARILGQLVAVLGGGRGGPESGVSWPLRLASDRLFVRARRLLGLRFKLVVLLVAEVVGGEMYRALVPLLPGPALRRALREIAADEDQHLRFHAAFMRAQGAAERWALRSAFWLVGAAAGAVVLGENRGDLHRLGLGSREVGGRIGAGLMRADQLAFGAGEVVS